jgi:hypothetical protein
MNERSLSAKKLFLKKERLEREKSLKAREQEGQQVVSSLYKIQEKIATSIRRAS